MNRSFSSFPITEIPDIKQNLLAWAATFPLTSVLDSCNYSLPYSSFDVLVGAGLKQKFVFTDDFPSSLSTNVAATDDWIFGHIGYDCLSEKTTATTPDQAFFFIPEFVVKLTGDTLSIGTFEQDAERIFNNILSATLPPQKKYTGTVRRRISRTDFVKTVNTLKQHIQRGDCYEINYCQEFYIEALDADPLDLYRQLTAISPNPFSAFYKVNNQFVLSASPERYLKKLGEKIISQPIKGTAARVLNNPDLDNIARMKLQASEKDMRENVIVVDLVRNDLSRVCEPGTVVVEELFGIYAFPAVFQMTSTVAGKLLPENDISSVLKASFPMGSMTGAPKKKVLELIDMYEATPRGIYSGAIGYIDPDKNYDFNVAIRSILYNTETKYLSYSVGAGITHMSEAEEEYEECLLKAIALQNLFTE